MPTRCPFSSLFILTTANLWCEPCIKLLSVIVEPNNSYSYKWNGWFSRFVRLSYSTTWFAVVRRDVVKCASELCPLCAPTECAPTFERSARIRRPRSLQEIACSGVWTPRACSVPDGNYPELNGPERKTVGKSTERQTLRMWLYGSRNGTRDYTFPSE